MPVSLVFCDSFANYDTAGIPLMWSTAGGAIETAGPHVRTGPQSLRIQAGASPTITNFNFPANTAPVGGIQGFPRFTVGFAWQTDTLAGETIVTLTNIAGVSPSPSERQFFLVQNADGSISVWTGNVPVLIGTTAAAVLTVGPFWYIEFAVNMITAELVLTVTNAAGVATEVLTASAFTTSQVSIDALSWGGPAATNHAWIADFYFGNWDGAAPSAIGAPKIYGLSVPNADGEDVLGIQPGVTPPAFDVTSPPFWPQCSDITQNTSLFMSRALVAASFYPAPCGQAFKYDVSSVPLAAVVAALQVTMLMTLGPDGSGNVPIQVVLLGTTGDSGSFISTGGNTPIVGGPFVFYPCPFDLDPVTGLAWTVPEFIGGAARQIGPNFLQQG